MSSRFFLSWRITPCYEFSQLSPVSTVNLSLSVSSSHDPSLSLSVVAVAADQASSYRHAWSSRSEPRRRVSRFKLTRQRALWGRASERERDREGERTWKKSEREREVNARVRDSRMTSATPRPRLHLATTSLTRVGDRISRRWRWWPRCCSSYRVICSLKFQDGIARARFASLLTWIFF